MALLASLSMILTSTMAAEHRALLAQQSKTHPAAVQAANKKAIKTEEGAGKTIDYTLYNYGTAGVLGSLGHNL